MTKTGRPKNCLKQEWGTNSQSAAWSINKEQLFGQLYINECPEHNQCHTLLIITRNKLLPPNESERAAKLPLRRWTYLSAYLQMMYLLPSHCPLDQSVRICHGCDWCQVFELQSGILREIVKNWSSRMSVLRSCNIQLTILPVLQ